METICIWSAVSSNELHLLQYTMSNAFIDEAITHIVILVTGPTKHNDTNYLSEKYHKVQIQYKDFGYGYNTSIEDGGYNQIEARNWALKIAEETEADWLIQYDADEFFDSRIFSKLCSSAQHLDAIYCNYFTLVKMQEYWHEDARLKKSGDFTLYDPRMRIWRTSLRLRYQRAKKNIEREFINVTRHCGVALKKTNKIRIGLFHKHSIYHLHCLLGKRHTSLKKTTKILQFELPNDLYACLTTIQSKLLLNVHD